MYCMHWKYPVITLLLELFMLWSSVSPSELVHIGPQKVKLIGWFRSHLQCVCGILKSWVFHLDTTEIWARLLRVYIYNSKQSPQKAWNVCMCYVLDRAVRATTHWYRECGDCHFQQNKLMAISTFRGKSASWHINSLKVTGTLSQGPQHSRSEQRPKKFVKDWENKNEICEKKCINVLFHYHYFC